MSAPSPDSDDAALESMFSESDLDEIESMLQSFRDKEISEQEVRENISNILAKSKSIQPKLTLPVSILNGIIPIKIENINKLIQGIDFGKFLFSCSIAYKFNLSSPIKHYEDGQVFLRRFDSLRADGLFWIKVPLFLLSYSMDFVISVNFAERETLKKYKEYISDEKSIQIPSLLIENKIFNTGDRVQYKIPNASYVRVGKIAKFLENDMIQIRSDPDYEPNDPEEEQKLMTVIHKDDVSRDAIDKLFLIDLTNLVLAQYDLILLSSRNDTDKDEESSSEDEDEDEDEDNRFDTFCEICDGLLDVYCELWDNGDISEYNEADAQLIPDSIAVRIYGFLFHPQYNYRVNCIFDGDEMFAGEQWEYYVRRTIDDFKNGVDANDVQDAWLCTGYSCDICRCEVRYYEWMWHCKNRKCKHDFCLSCVNYMVQQYYQMKQLLVDILKGVVNRDIIEEIVVFSVGKVNKFNVESL